MIRCSESCLYYINDWEEGGIVAVIREGLQDLDGGDSTIGFDHFDDRVWVIHFLFEPAFTSILSTNYLSPLARSQKETTHHPMA